MTDQAFSVLKRTSPDGKYVQFYIDDGGVAFVLGELDVNAWEAKRKQFLADPRNQPAKPVAPTAEVLDGTTTPPQQ